MTDLSPAAVEAAARAEVERRWPGLSGMFGVHHTTQGRAFVAGAMWAAARAGDDTGACCDTVCNGKRTPGCAMSAAPVPSSADDPRAEDVQDALTVALNDRSSGIGLHARTLLDSARTTIRDLRAEVERLRGRLDRRGWTVSRLQDSRDQVLARAEAAEREVADLRARIAAAVDALPTRHGTGIDGCVPLRALKTIRALAGSGEQPGEHIGDDEPAWDNAVRETFGDALDAGFRPRRPAPVVPDIPPPGFFGPNDPSQPRAVVRPDEQDTPPTPDVDYGPTGPGMG